MAMRELAAMRPARDASPKPLKRRESAIQTVILAFLRAHRIPAWKVGAGAFRVGDRYVRMGQKGMSDIIGIIPRTLAGVAPPWPKGIMLAIEVKRPGGKPTAEQAAFLAMVREAGGVAFVASSVDDVVRMLGL